VDIGCLYLGQDMIAVYGLAVSMSGYGCERMGWLCLGQDIRMKIWAG
jgi:hypothetical protein